MTERPACPACDARLNVVPESKTAGRAAWIFVIFLALALSQMTCQLAPAFARPGVLLTTLLAGLGLGLLLTAAALAPLFAAGGAVLFRGGFSCCPRCDYLLVDGEERPGAKRRWRSTLGFYRHTAAWLLVAIPFVALLGGVRTVSTFPALPIPEILTVVVLAIAWLALTFAAGRLRRALDERRPAWERELKYR